MLLDENSIVQVTDQVARRCEGQLVVESP